MQTAEGQEKGDKVEVGGGVIRVDEIVATVVVILRDKRVQYCSGCVRGGSVTEEPPAYAQEAGVFSCTKGVPRVDGSPKPGKF